LTTDHRILQCAALVVLASCSERPVRIVAGVADTSIVNSRQPVQLPVRILGATGRELASRGLRYEWLSGDPIQLSEDGRVTCDRSGDAVVRVSRDELSKQFVVHCRPIQAFRSSRSIRLLAGGASEELIIGAVGVDLKPVSLLAGKASVRDTTIAMLTDGRVHPKRPGSTFVDVAVGDCLTSIRVDVVERVDSTLKLGPSREFVIVPLQLVGGELRSWRVPSGRYDVRLDADSSQRARLVLAALGMNCARFPDGDQHYSCIARAGARVVVRNPRSPGQSLELSGALTIQSLENRPSANERLIHNAANGDRQAISRADRSTMCPEMRFMP
jgi:hypothetical protein